MEDRERVGLVDVAPVGTEPAAQPDDADGSVKSLRYSKLDRFPASGPACADVPEHVDFDTGTVLRGRRVILVRSLEIAAARAQGGLMPTVPVYRIRPGDRLEVVQPDGGGPALVIAKLDAVPEGAGGRALRIRVCDAQVRMLPAAGVS